MMNYNYEKAQRSTDWLRENYSHIWEHRSLSNGEKAGYLAACCNATRCYLMTLSLVERIGIIQAALLVKGEP